jgi:hypothetical protein
VTQESRISSLIIARGCSVERRKRVRVSRIPAGRSGTQARGGGSVRGGGRGLAERVVAWPLSSEPLACRYGRLSQDRVRLTWMMSTGPACSSVNTAAVRGPP